jgi:multisubunit Na+/H+ antiporter MnhF subunit
VRLGRKTYIVDMAAGNKRTDYVAVSNTIIGIILLITGGISALVSLISVEGIILVLSLIGIVGAFMSSKLPSVE